MPDTNKVILGDEVLIDLTSDTVSADNMLQGTTAHDASGRSITGAVVVAPIDKEMSSSSKNPVENNVINAAIEKSLSDAKKYSDDKVSNLVGSAPETLDTLEEISRALKDNNQIVDVLNEAISSKVSKEDGKGLSSNDYTNAEKEKLKGIEAGANKTVVDGVLSNTSENPVQNKVVNAEVANKADKEIISDVWNASTTYAVGQYCIYNNTLWKCLVQHNGQTPTEGTYWTKVSVGNEIASVNSSLSNVKSKTNKINLNDVTEFGIQTNHYNGQPIVFVMRVNDTLFYQLSCTDKNIVLQKVENNVWINVWSK